ncbi:MAG: 3-methyl-2-oxobutanoate hydroxymethyltransferase [Nitrosopumilus sp.]|nr:3-methyl-2-oxobutanoate hydroxymethyltransferase [Nitrosopumilus sp.]
MQKLHKSVSDILRMKKEKKKISVITSYDYTLASLCDKAGIDVLLVGDSAGMVMLGYENTVTVTMDQMCMFTEAVSRARKNALLVSDLPFMSYQASIEDAISNSGKLIKAGADAVKLEGGSIMAETISAIVDVGIPVMGHIGLQPQTTILSQGYKVQGKTKDTAMKLIEDAKDLEEAGVFSIALEMVSHEVAEIISQTVSVPIIGIGSGVGCDGQVLVIQDLLGMYDKIKPKFAKRYMNLSEDIVKSLEDYKNDVISGTFPAEENWFSMEEEELKKLREQIGS